ncbi:MAG TPA: nitrilase [Synergistaceae bacterium]|nr:nitrilase [Synergistaceae bacterium]
MVLKELTVHIIQSDVLWGNPSGNIPRMEERLRRIPDGPSLVILPELWTCSYDNARIREHARQSPVALEMMSSTCRRKGFSLVGGSIPWVGPAGELFNRSFFIGDSGEVIGHYDKAHLFPLLDEPLFFQAGKTPFLFEFMGIPSAIAICFDIRFPEFIRSLALSGAELVLVPAEWPSTRIDHWETLLRARAIENQVFIVGCNRCGEGGGQVYGGRSLAFGPDGTLIVLCPGDREMAAMVPIKPSLVRKIRKEHPFMVGRNPLLYHPVTSFDRNA